MFKSLKLTALGLALVCLGCSQEVEPPDTVWEPTPLGIAEWRELPVDQKYDEATFDRLKMRAPELQNERNWAKFMRETIIPERKRDLPDDLPS